MGSRGIRESKGNRESEVIRGSKGVGIPSVRERGVSASIIILPKLEQRKQIRILLGKARVYAKSINCHPLCVNI